MIGKLLDGLAGWVGTGIDWRYFGQEHWLWAKALWRGQKVHITVDGMVGYGRRVEEEAGHDR